MIKKIIQLKLKTWFVVALQIATSVGHILVAHVLPVHVLRGTFDPHFQSQITDLHLTLDSVCTR